MKYFDTNSRASDPLNIKISKKNLKYFRPDLFGLSGFILKIRCKLNSEIFDELTYIKEQLQNGDSQPAIVINDNPLKIAVYSDELDCVTLLSFPSKNEKNILNKYNLKIGTKLISTNLYKSGGDKHSDLNFGTNYMGRYNGFNPLIAEFVSTDTQKINKRKSNIDKQTWDYVYKLGVEYKNNEFTKGTLRLGIPGKSFYPIKFKVVKK